MSNAPSRPGSIESTLTIDSADADVVKPRGLPADVFCEAVEDFEQIRDTLAEMEGAMSFSVTLRRGGRVTGRVHLDVPASWKPLNDLFDEYGFVAHHVDNTARTTHLTASDGGHTERVVLEVAVLFRGRLTDVS